MNLNEFMEKYDIAIAACVNRQEMAFDIIKSGLKLESDDLFKQLILFGSVDSLVESIKGQILPRIWTQGNSKCIVCQPRPMEIIALFYDSSRNIKDEYVHAIALDKLLKELQEKEQ